MKQRIQGMVIGLILAALLSSTTTWASDLLQSIYVHMRPITIFIDGQEKTPPEDMKPLSMVDEHLYLLHM